MAVFQATINDVDLLARLIRAEAEREGDLGMLIIGNVGVNRIRADCPNFPYIRMMNDMVFHAPDNSQINGFPGVLNHIVSISRLLVIVEVFINLKG